MGEPGEAAGGEGVGRLPLIAPMRLALAQVTHPESFEDGLAAVRSAIGEAAAAGAEIVCFPECCLKGMRGTDFPVEALTVAEHDAGLAEVRRLAREHRIVVVLPTERPRDGAWQNGAWVVGGDGEVQGYQTKNQVPLEEEPFFVPGTGRRLFRLGDVAFGIAICHEGWRYPETVRWAAVRGASLVLHPHFCGGREAAAGGRHDDGPSPPWGSGFYEKAMACRAAENHLWFASVNFALPQQDCATSIVSPEGDCLASAPLHRAELLVADIDPAAATGYLARRFAPGRYAEEPAS